MKLATKILREFVERTGITKTQLAKDAECSRSYLSEILSGKKDKLSIALATRLEAATNREVKVSYWSEEVEDEI